MQILLNRDLCLYEMSRPVSLENMNHLDSRLLLHDADEPLKHQSQMLKTIKMVKKTQQKPENKA